MGPTANVAWSFADGVGRIVLSRNEAANALSYDMGCRIAQAVDELIALNPRVVLLSAEGSIFCAGGDINEFVSVADGLEPFIDRILNVVHPAMHRLATGPFAVVSALNGPIGGAGVGLALCADFVLASETMKRRTGYAALGLSPDLGSTYFLAPRVGAARAKRWFMLSDTIDARTCLASSARCCSPSPRPSRSGRTMPPTRSCSGAGANSNEASGCAVPARSRSRGSSPPATRATCPARVATRSSSRVRCARSRRRTGWLPGAPAAQRVEATLDALAVLDRFPLPG